MSNKKGFTLVELLAVIVVLAVILVIAIPNIIKIIDKAKLDSYKRNEDMLVSATQKYMAQNGITLNTVGQTTTINYSDLKTNNLIANINDQTDNNASTKECSNSRVVVTKTTSGYSYKPGLVCTNYISLDTFNLVTNGDFSNGTTGWNASSGTSINASLGEFYFTTQVLYGGASSTILNYSQYKSHVIYFSGFIKVDSNSVYFLLNDGTNQTLTSTNTFGKFIFVSNIRTVDPNATTLYIRLQDSRSSNWTENRLKSVMAVDLTSIYGAGNEPTQAQIDNLINKSR